VSTLRHAGVLVPWANTVVEAELPAVTRTDVTWHYARLVPSSRTTALDSRFLEGLLEAVPGALAQLSALPVRRVYLACTSAAVMYPDTIRAAQCQAGVGLVSAFDAITCALAACAATRIVLLTPYPDPVTSAEAQMFARSGITVTGSACLGLDDGYDTVRPEQVMGLIRCVSRAAMGEAEAIVLSCTGWPTADLQPQLQRDTGKPVLSSNLAIAWHARQPEET
jgi:maleate isomerase